MGLVVETLAWTVVRLLQRSSILERELMLRLGFENRIKSKAHRPGWGQLLGSCFAVSTQLLAFRNRRGAATVPLVCSLTLSVNFFGHFVADVIAGQQYAEIGSVGTALPATAAATATSTSADHHHFFVLIITRIFIRSSLVALVTRWLLDRYLRQSLQHHRVPPQGNYSEIYSTVFYQWKVEG